SEMVDAMLNGEIEKAKEINLRLYPMFESMFLETNPIPVKKAAEMMGLLPAGHVRLPLGALSASNEEKLKAVLKGQGMLG
ncbi:4-hydroxy-tetrahydrodipicolinate synthase, partial [ANME-1 cluster archaeon GoMg3.2]|nr:4-hydroxy-tetrahydrodipicolinate synthase [ANME-1 cluster archaeon GoMg3.2]